jgi:hypothetical protein
MSDRHGVEALLSQLRTHVAELRQLRARGVEMTELRRRERKILRLQQQLALAVSDQRERRILSRLPPSRP